MNSDDAQRAFVELIERHRGILFKVAAAYCANPSDREDLVQETIAQLWRAYPGFDGRSSFPTWMYRIAMNVAIGSLRKETRNRRAVAPAGTAILEQIAEPQSENDDRLGVVRALVASLAPLDRALMLLYLDDYPYAEIAATLGISESNVGTKIGRIKERLKRDAPHVIVS